MHRVTVRLLVILIVWQRSVVVSALASIIVVNRHWPWLLLGWVTAYGQVNCLGMKPAL